MPGAAELVPLLARRAFGTGSTRGGTEEVCSVLRRFQEHSPLPRAFVSLSGYLNRLFSTGS